MPLIPMRATFWAAAQSICAVAAVAAQTPLHSSSRLPACISIVFSPDSTTYRSLFSILAARDRDSTAPLPPPDSLTLGGNPDTTLLRLDTIPWRGENSRPGDFLADELQRPGAVLDPTAQGLWYFSGDTLIISNGGYGWHSRYRVAPPYFNHAGTGAWWTHMGYAGYGRASLSQVDCP